MIPVADFEDPKAVKVVELMRPVGGSSWAKKFLTLEDVPRYAISLTIPSIMKCKKIISVVPDGRKAEAGEKGFEGPIETACPFDSPDPPDVTIFLDQDSAFCCQTR